MNPMERLISRCTFDDNNCWNVSNSKGKYGNGYYPTFMMNGKSSMASRASWILQYGDIPTGMLVCHKCDNTACVNPFHLFLGTHKDNSMDRMNKGGRLGRISKVPSDEHHEELRKIAYEEKTSMSEEVRKAIAEYLERKRDNE